MVQVSAVVSLPKCAMGVVIAINPFSTEACPAKTACPAQSLFAVRPTVPTKCAHTQKSGNLILNYAMKMTQPGEKEVGHSLPLLSLYCSFDPQNRIWKSGFSTRALLSIGRQWQSVVAKHCSAYADSGAQWQPIIALHRLTVAISGGQALLSVGR